MSRAKLLIPFVILLVAGLGAAALYASRPKPQTKEPVQIRPLVSVHRVELADRQLTVTSQGTVNPRTQTVLVPEVGGRVIEVSAAFAPGGFFEVGELLLRIDPHDYQQALVRAQSQEAQARLRLAQVEAEARLARDEWEQLGEGEADALTLLEPQLADARATLAAALAGIDQAQTNVARCEIRAPYAGRVQSKQADRGQVVGPGTPLATIYAVDIAEIRLPLADDQLAFVDLPLGYRGEHAASGPRVIVRAEFGGQLHEWKGRIVRTEGMIDPVSRMIHTVAQIKDPYGRSEPGRPPLAVGMFVEAEIVGKTATAVAAIPRAAMRPDGTLLIVDQDDRLRFREVVVLRAMRDTLLVSAGLADGDRVCISALSAVTDGMQVIVREGDS